MRPWAWIVLVVTALALLIAITYAIYLRNTKCPGKKESWVNFIGAVIGLFTPILFFLTLIFFVLLGQTDSSEGTTDSASGASRTGFRFYSTAGRRVGLPVTPVLPPLKQRMVRDLLALPERNKATCLTIVTIPKSQIVKEKKAAPKNNRPGGGDVIVLKKESELKNGWFSQGLRTPWAPRKTKSPKC